MKIECNGRFTYEAGKNVGQRGATQGDVGLVGRVGRRGARLSSDTYLLLTKCLRNGQLIVTAL